MPAAIPATTETRTDQGRMMADHTHIEWTDATWNIINGCTLVDEGCRHCYAARLAATRLQHIPSRKGLARINAAGEAKFTGEVRFNAEWLDQPLRWKKPRRIFVCAHGDLFHESVPDDWIDKVFAIMALAPQHTFQVLTKRPDRMRAYLSDKGRKYMVDMAVWALDGEPEEPTRPTIPWPLPNVWLGTSISDQASADARIPDLLATPAAVRFVSAEPLLGPVDIRHFVEYDPLYEKQTKRDICLPVCDQRGFGDSTGRHDLEAPQAGLGSLARQGNQSSMSASESRTRQRRILSGESDARRKEGLGLGSSPSLATLQGAYPRWDHGQPPERNQERQPSEQSGIGDLSGAATTRDPHFEDRPRSGSGWSEEQHGAIDDRANSGNQGTETGGRAFEGNSGRLRDSVSDRFEDCSRRPAINLIICGGESGPKARPMHPDWARSLRDQCQAAGVAFFFKQWGEWGPDTGPAPGKPDREMEGRDPCAWFDGNAWHVEADGFAVPVGAVHSIGEWVYRKGKGRNGRLLDGAEWSQMPGATP
jgi:protein gp37